MIAQIQVTIWWQSFPIICPKICGNVPFMKNLITQKIMRKAGIFAVNTWKPLSILEKLRWLNHHFIIKKNKRLNTRLRKPNYESSLVAIYYKVEENYFKGKIWVLHKLKTKTSGKAYSFEIIFAHFCHDSNVSHFTFRKSIEVFSVK